MLYIIDINAFFVFLLLDLFQSYDNDILNEKSYIQSITHQFHQINFKLLDYFDTIIDEYFHR